MASPIFDVREPMQRNEGIAQARAALDAGGLVVFPTETVYGIAARADSLEGVARLRKTKERSEDKPFTLHVANRSDLDRYAPSVPPIARRFAKKGWPGPLTLLVSVPRSQRGPAAEKLNEEVQRAIFHEDTLGIRCPDEATALELLAGVSGPVVAASANRADQPPAVEMHEALKQLEDDVDVWLDGGRARYARSSTIVRIGENGYEMVREGIFDQRMINGMASMQILFVCTGNTCRSPMAEGIARKLVAERLGCSIDSLAEKEIRIKSAGTYAFDGAPAAPNAVEVMQERGIDISSHTSTRLSVELINESDHIFAMTVDHQDDVTRMLTTASDRTVPLSVDGDITDPIGGDVDIYASCADRIEEAFRSRLEEIEI